ncbi:MAG: ChrR family anti-sigma-E factor [Thalassobaculum sp.]|uniref:ChrR family anti-sigma-E factor n=1 Tax=Thalassobaculum sp. TaxID=2022740 RepID=UPI0032EF6E5A
MTDTAPTFHPESEAVLAYAAGGLDEAHAVLVATHLALCPRCRAEVARLEAVGGALTASIEPAPMSAGALAATLARLDEPGAEPEPSAAVAYDDETLHAIPAPLRDYLGGNLSGLPWKWRGPTIRELPLSIGSGTARATLIRVRPGAAIPAHTHAGTEATLVLRGAYQDATGRFGRGDVETASSDLDHRPVATADSECICFSVIDGPLSLTGPIGRLLNPFLKI